MKAAVITQDQVMELTDLLISELVTNRSPTIVKMLGLMASLNVKEPVAFQWDGGRVFRKRIPKKEVHSKAWAPIFSQE